MSTYFLFACQVTWRRSSSTSPEYCFPYFCRRKGKGTQERVIMRVIIRATFNTRSKQYLLPGLPLLREVEGSGKRHQSEQNQDLHVVGQKEQAANNLRERDVRKKTLRCKLWELMGALESHGLGSHMLLGVTCFSHTTLWISFPFRVWNTKSSIT